MTYANYLHVVKWNGPRPSMDADHSVCNQVVTVYGSASSLAKHQSTDRPEGNNTQMCIVKTNIKSSTFKGINEGRDQRKVLAAALPSIERSLNSFLVVEKF